jgi:hypothetical protein
MRLYIPELGDELLIISDWTFGLYNEDRNASMMKKMGDTRPIGYKWGAKATPIPCTVPAGATLKIDRIYIRKGQDDFNSVTFFWVGEAIPAHESEIMGFGHLPDGTSGWNVPTGKFQRVPKKPIRFWAKMSDVNTIEFE